jgi:hypothetical protein
MDKRGSHVGMILSFVLFVTALIFLYDIMRPVTQTTNEKEKLIEQVRMSLEKELQRELTTSTVRITVSGEENKNKCVKLNYSKLGENLSEEHLVKFVSGKTIKSKIDGESIFIENTSEPLRIFFAEELINENFSNPPECTDADGNGNNIGYTFTTSKKDYYFEKDLEKFLEEIKQEENYSKIKEEFLLPKDADFNLIIIFNGETKGEEKNVSGTNVFANRYPIIYLNSSADVNSGFFDISVW